MKFEDRKTAFFVIVYRKDLEGLIENTERDLQVTKQFLKQFLENEMKILDYIRNKPNITQAELSSNLGISTRAVRKNMKKLKDREIIERIGSDRKGYWKIKWEKLGKILKLKK